jgi:hypothetical protein
MAVNRLRQIIRDPKARADIEDNWRKTVGQLFGGIAVLLGAGFSYYQFKETLNETRLSREASQKSSRDLLVSQQVSKGFEQLGSQEVVLRLGGIYALEGVIKVSPEYRRSIVEGLCAFVRERSRTQSSSSPIETDVLAAVTVLLRNVTEPDTPLNLSDVSLPGINLDRPKLSTVNLHGANLSGAWLVSADLSKAILDNANLSSATIPDANLSGAFLRNASLSKADLSEVVFSSPDRSLRETVLAANLSEASLSGANLSGARLSGVSLGKTNLTGADLTGADLSGAKQLTREQLDQACGDPNTKLLPGSGFRFAKSEAVD